MRRWLYEKVTHPEQGVEDLGELGDDAGLQEAGGAPQQQAHQHRSPRPHRLRHLPRRLHRLRLHPVHQGNPSEQMPGTRGS